MSGEDQPPLSDAVVTSIRNGNMIEAIKQIRVERGLGLKEAKELAESYASGQQSPGHDPQRKVVNDPQAPLSDAVITALRTGNKIEAIKQIRAERGLGLKEAKDLAEDYVKSQPDLAEKYARQSLPGGLGFLIALAVIALAVFALVRR